MPAKKTKRQKQAEERAARAAALASAFKANCRDPEHPLYDDPVWNPGHRLYPMVQKLVGEGMLGGEAEQRARMLEAYEVIEGGLLDGSLPPS